MHVLLHSFYLFLAIAHFLWTVPACRTNWAPNQRKLVPEKSPKGGDQEKEKPCVLWPPGLNISKEAFTSPPLNNAKKGDPGEI